MTKLIFCALPLFSVIACTSSPSDQIRTGGMYASLTASSWGDGGTDVSLLLNVGSDSSTTYVEVLPPDQLMASVNADAPIPMTQSGVLGLITYSASFDTMDADTRFTVSLSRGPDDDSAPNTSATLPEGFDLTGPSQRTLAQDLSVEWAPSGGDDLMRVLIQGACISTYEIEIPGDPGRFTLPAGEIKAFESTDPMPSCAITLELSRQREGTVDPAFAGGSAIGEQRRLLDIEMTL